MKTAAVKDKAKVIAELASNKKGEDIVLMNMSGVSTVCDWFVLISASSSRRVHSICKEIQKKLSSEGVSPISVEGRQSSYWTVLDYEDVVVHIFYREIREFYGLERLWSDAPLKRFDAKCLAKTSQKK